MTENGQHELPDPPEVQKVRTAFLVLLHEDGSAVGHTDVNLPIEVGRVASFNDMYSGCAQVMRDVQIMQTNQTVVQNTVNTLMQAMQQQMEAVQTAQLAKGLNLR